MRDAPQFPLAAGAAAPLRAAGEKRGSSDFSPLWAGESAALAREEGAEALTRRLWADGHAVMMGLSEPGRAEAETRLQRSPRFAGLFVLASVRGERCNERDPESSRRFWSPTSSAIAGLRARTRSARWRDFGPCAAI